MIFNVESEEVPKLDFVIEFNTLFQVFTRVIGEINKESTIYDVLASEISKSINPPEVGAYANTNMQIINTISNTGTANINSLDIIDDVPKDFILQKSDQIKLILKKPKPENQLEIQDRSEFISKIVIEPDVQDPEIPHQIIITLKNLKEIFIPKAELIMQYSLIAKNPKPDISYNTPIQLKVNTEREGDIFEITTPQEPIIKIRYIQRKLKTLKSILPGDIKGEFNISVKIQNKGDVELENIIVQDKIPKGFSLSEFTPPEDTTFENIQKGPQSELKVNINVLEANKSIKINYKCTGSGEYPRNEPEITVLGRSELSTLDKIISKDTPVEESLEKTPDIANEIVPDIEVSPILLLKINDAFSEIYNKIDSSITISELYTTLDEMLDMFPQGSVRVVYKSFLQEFQTIEDKTRKTIGPLQDSLKRKITLFEKRFK